MVVRALVVPPQPRVGGNIAVRQEPVLVTARLPTCWAHVGVCLVFRLGGGCTRKMSERRAAKLLVRSIAPGSNARASN